MYDPPMTLKQIEARYGTKFLKRLQACPIHGWRAKYGIELIHKEPTKDELVRIWNNWQQMPPAMKRISDKRSYELFGIDNKTHYDQLIKQY